MFLIYSFCIKTSDNVINWSDFVFFTSNIPHKERKFCSSVAVLKNVTDHDSFYIVCGVAN